MKLRGSANANADARPVQANANQDQKAQQHHLAGAEFFAGKNDGKISENRAVKQQPANKYCCVDPSKRSFWFSFPWDQPHCSFLVAHFFPAL
jgi:hypothetical protein